MVKAQGLSISQVCEDMRLGESAVRRWVSQFEAEQQGQSGAALPGSVCGQRSSEGGFCSLMRLNGLRPVWKRKFVHTTDSKHTMPVSPNVLARQFEKPLPNQAWVSDITCIRTHSG